MTPIASHAAIVAARCVSIANAMRIVNKNSSTAPIAGYPGAYICFKEQSNLANYPHWQIFFPNSSSSILAALAAFFYCDRLLPLPKHRLPILIIACTFVRKAMRKRFKST
jgi:hypothetical protein